MFVNKRLTLVFLAALVALAACNLPANPRKDPNAVYTEAAQTVQAQLTQQALLIPSATPPPPASPTLLPPVATFTPLSTASPTPICDLALYVKDVSVPDGTQFLPGQTFTKTWRLKNIGVCTWTGSYQLIFDNGAIMDGPSPQALTGPVAPGQEVDLSINLKAPVGAGPYRGYWRLRNPAGILMPVVSGYTGTAFFVDIKVVTATGTATITPTVTLAPTGTATPTPTGTP
jgi:hypothetical protein